MRKSKWDFGWKTWVFLAFFDYLMGIINSYFFIKYFSIAHLIIASIGFVAGTMAIIGLGKKVKYI